jgi:drug/metabolite transporter (DMT)-like permease
MSGLAQASASSASLLLNLEGAFTRLIAWFAFRENFDRRIAFGLLLILTGACFSRSSPAARSASASARSASRVPAWHGQSTTTSRGASPPATRWRLPPSRDQSPARSISPSPSRPARRCRPPAQILSAGLIGLLGYGVSLALFVSHARSSARRAPGRISRSRPFAGVALAMAVLGEVPGTLFWIALPLISERACGCT